MATLTLPWKKLPLDGEVAKAIRHDIRKHRRERGRAGHRFRYDDLRSLHAASDTYAVLTHVADPVWQLFYNHPELGWTLASWHFTRREAQVAALKPMPDLGPKPKAVVEGLHVLAAWPKQKPTMRVLCSSEATASAVESAFKHIGCETARETVSA